MKTLVVILSLMLTELAHAQLESQTFRNDQGQQTGRADRHGNTTTFKDPQGRETGRAESRPDGSVIYFNERGQRTGSSSPGSTRERR
jgi:hypothetical protein